MLYQRLNRKYHQIRQTRLRKNVFPKIYVSFLVCIQLIFALFLVFCGAYDGFWVFLTLCVDTGMNFIFWRGGRHMRNMLTHGVFHLAKPVPLLFRNNSMSQLWCRVSWPNSISSRWDVFNEIQVQYKGSAPSF